MKILFSSWLGYPHSFSYVAENHFKELASEDHKLYLYKRHPLCREWEQSYKPINISTENSGYISKEACSRDEFDLSIDMAVPPHIPPFRSKCYCTFMVSEFSKLTDAYLNMLPKGCSIKDISDNSDFIYTPSEWSSEALQRSGIDGSKIRVIPHSSSVPHHLARHSPQELRTRLCQSLKINANNFIILNIGTPSRNKGVDSLLETLFASDLTDQITLIFKGNDALYSSKSHFKKLLNLVSAKYKKRLDVRYIGSKLSSKELDFLISGVDIYASLFRAEGFNLPVLESYVRDKVLLITKAAPVTEFIKSDEKVFWVDHNIKSSSEGYLFHEPIIESSVSALHQAISCIKSEISKSKIERAWASWSDVTQLLKP